MKWATPIRWVQTLTVSLCQAKRLVRHVRYLDVGLLYPLRMKGYLDEAATFSAGNSLFFMLTEEAIQINWLDHLFSRQGSGNTFWPFWVLYFGFPIEY